MKRNPMIQILRLPATEKILWTWLALGLLAAVSIPGFGGFDQTLGWMPYWLVVAPLIDLALIHRNRLWPAARDVLVHARRRHRPARQARRLRHHHAEAAPSPLRRKRLPIAVAAFVALRNSISP